MKPSILLSFFVCLLGTGLTSAVSQSLSDLEHSLAPGSSDLQSFYYDDASYPHPSQQPEQTFSDYMHARGGYQTYDTQPVVDEEDDDLSTGSIIGIGSAVFAAAVVAPALTYRRHKQKKKRREQKEKDRLEQEARFKRIEAEQLKQQTILSTIRSPREIRADTEFLKSRIEALEQSQKKQRLFKAMPNTKVQVDRLEHEYEQNRRDILDRQQSDENRQRNNLAARREVRTEQRARKKELIRKFPNIPRLKLPKR